jgi:hypothetical protein
VKAAGHRPAGIADDERRRETAARIGLDFPRRLVMWGTYSRQYWAYPLFDAPAGTIVHSADPDEVARKMHAMQMENAGRR